MRRVAAVLAALAVAVGACGGGPARRTDEDADLQAKTYARAFVPGESHRYRFTAVFSGESFLELDVPVSQSIDLDVDMTIVERTLRVDPAA